MTFLLDINVLLALFDRNHIHHNAAHEWFGETGRENWATCPITENGFVRIASRTAYPNQPGNTTQTVAWFKLFCKESGHKFWPDSVSFLSIVDPETVIAPNQITDLYLLGLAVANGGKLATFDLKIPTKAIKGGNKAIELLG